MTYAMGDIPGDPRAPRRGEGLEVDIDQLGGQVEAVVDALIARTGGLAEVPVEEIHAAVLWLLGDAAQTLIERATRPAASVPSLDWEALEEVTPVSKPVEPTRQRHDTPKPRLVPPVALSRLAHGLEGPQ